MPQVAPALIIQNATPVTHDAGARLKRIRPNLFFGQVYRNLISRPRALRSDDLSGPLGNIPVLRCVVRREGRFSEYFSDADVAEIRRHDLAFILRFGFSIIKGDILHAALYGVWSFHHGDEEKYRGVSEGFWEISRGEHVAGAILQKLNEKLDAGTILRKGHFAVTDYSWAKTRDTLFFGSAAWPAQVCTDILNGVADYVDSAPSTSTAPLHYRPTNIQTLFHLSRIGNNFLRHCFARAFVQTTWGIGIVDANATSLLAGAPPPTRFIPGTTGRFRYLADPFFLGAGERDAVAFLCEEFSSWSTDAGRIVRVLMRNGEVDEQAAVIDTGHHRSYPFVLRHDGEIYCIPEAAELGRIELHRATVATPRWTLHAILIDNVKAYDPTIFQHGERWWLAATLGNDGPYHNLHLWHAPSLTGPWTPHANNPVKCDVRSARSAGTPFVVDGTLYRPAQDCSEGYGRRIAINVVHSLSPLVFRESVVAVLRPAPASPFPDGMHTLCIADGCTLVDGRRDFFDPFKLLIKLLIAPAVRRIRRRLARTAESGG